MPVYEYRCREGHRYERTQGFHSATEHECLHCGKPAQRQISVPAVIFKGSGFYSTDNRRGGGSKNGGSSSDAGDSEAGAKTVSASDGDGHSEPADSGADSKVKAGSAD